MKVLVIVDANISDPSWVPSYLEAVTAIVAKYGGRYVSRSPRPELLEGDELPQFSVVAEFESAESAKAFYNSAEYQPFKQLRQQGSSGRMLLVPVENETEYAN
jgi:uncharacterized protein (DUF1330 family)